MNLKNKFLNIFVALVLFSFLVSSCEEDSKVYNAGDNFHFKTATSSILESSSNTLNIPVVFTKTTAKSGTFSINIEGATENVDYVLLNGTKDFSLDADSYVDTIKIRVIDNEEFTGDKEVKISFAAASEATGWAGPDKVNSTHTLTILDDDCDLPLLGEFTTQSSVTFDGDPISPGGNPAIITKKSCKGDGEYLLDDITTGLLEGAGFSKNPVVFVVNGNTITIDSEQSPDLSLNRGAYTGSGKVLSGGSFQIDWAIGDGILAGSTTFTPK